MDAALEVETGRDRGGVPRGTDSVASSGAHPDSLRQDARLGVHLLPRRREHHGGHDLSAGPRSGLNVQLCGDAHLSNFGGFAAPDRDLVFDVNDFDETHPGPFEWDVEAPRCELRDRRAAMQRLHGAPSAGVPCWRSVENTARRWRQFAKSRNLAVWYARLTAEDLEQRLARGCLEEAQRRTSRARAPGTDEGQLEGVREADARRSTGRCGSSPTRR